MEDNGNLGNIYDDINDKSSFAYTLSVDDIKNHEDLFIGLLP